MLIKRKLDECQTPLSVLRSMKVSNYYSIAPFVDCLLIGSAARNHRKEGKTHSWRLCAQPKDSTDQTQHDTKGWQDDGRTWYS